MNKNLLLKSVIFIFNLVLASFFAFKAYELRQSHNEIQNWPEADAVVTSYAVYEQPKAPKTIIRDRWTPVWSYSFNLNGQNITSNSMSFENASLSTFKPSYQQAEAALNQFPLNEKIKIFYDPKNPSITIIEKWSRNSTKELLFLVLAISLLLIGIFVPIVLDSKNNKKEPV